MLFDYFPTSTDVESLMASPCDNAFTMRLPPERSEGWISLSCRLANTILFLLLTVAVCGTGIFPHKHAVACLWSCYGSVFYEHGVSEKFCLMRVSSKKRKEMYDTFIILYALWTMVLVREVFLFGWAWIKTWIIFLYSFISHEWKNFPQTSS